MSPRASAVRTVAFTSAALCGFAANSLLCRAALGGRLVDPWSFTGVRLASGAATLALITGIASRGAPREASARERGSWPSALALFLYAAAFSLAYVRIGASVGALLLFASVQGTMVGAALVAGERPSAAEWLGHAVAIGGLVALTLPGASAVDPIGAVLMVLAGIAWGVYSLRGRGAARPLLATSGNFARSVPFALAGFAAAYAVSAERPLADAQLSGVTLAAASGALASGVGYSLWYAALPRLSAMRAALVQLVTPALTAAAAVVVLGEAMTTRLLLGGAAILAGMTVAVVGARRRKE